MQEHSLKQQQMAKAECPQHDETTDHIMSVCPVLVKEQYTERYDESVCSTTL